MSDRKVFIDRGHGLNNNHPGQYDSGATSKFGEEHAIVAAVAEAVAVQMPRAVVLTPETNRQGVVDFVNEHSSPGDVLLVLHMDEGPEAATGVTCVYSHAAPPVRAAQAQAIADYVAHDLGLHSRGAMVDLDTPNGAKGGGLKVLDSERASFLLEIGFVSNSLDVTRVKSLGSRTVKVLCQKIISGVMV